MDKGVEYVTNQINKLFAEAGYKYKHSDSCTCVDGYNPNCPVCNKKREINPDEAYDREREMKND